jgi:argininosuccinate lyase
LQGALLSLAEEHVETLMPGYTHLQRAQAVTLGHHLLAWAEMLGRDRGRLLEAARRAGDSPLGSGALAGTGLPIDRARTAAELGFERPSRNSLDAVGDRDFAAETAFGCALLGVHLSRIGEELVLWSSAEFGFVRLGEPHCSGSSLMPQKRNPDVAELLRGKAGRLMGDVVALLAVQKGLPLAYNKDLQETQEPFFDAVETARLALSVVPGLVATLEFDARRLGEAARDPALGATDLAEHLVRDKGLPFRRAHEIVGGLVRLCEREGKSLRALEAAELAAVAPELDASALEALDPMRAVSARTLPGGPAPAQVLGEVERLEAELRELGYEP